jgi:hypothetical protein
MNIMSRISARVLIFCMAIICLASCSLPGGGSSGGGAGGGGGTGGGGAGGGSNPPNDNPKSGWTVIIQFAMDNNIDYYMENDFGLISNYLQTLEQIEAGDVNNKIDIVILFDAYSTDSMGVGYVSTFADGYYHLTGGNFADDLVLSVGEINSGSVSQTTAFLQWAVDHYPAEGYLYSVFNHGGGFDDANAEGTFAAARGIAFDEDAGDCLSHHELEQAAAFLKNKIGANIDLFYPYACLMGGVELAYQVRENADYILFSEELFPADYWSYGALKIITENDKVSAYDIGRAFCDSAYDYFTNVGRQPFSLSLVRLDMMDDLYGLLDDYGRAAVSDMQTNSDAFEYYEAAAWARSMVYDNNLNDDTYYYIDLGSYMYEISDLAGIGAGVRGLAADLIRMINDIVVYSKNTFYFKVNYKIMGLTIFHNMWYSEYTYPVAVYKSILSFGQNAWSDYQEEYMSHRINLAPDAYESDNTKDQTANTIAVGETQVHTSFPISKDQVFGNYLDRDFIRLDLSAVPAGTTLRIETFPLNARQAPHPNVSGSQDISFGISRYETAWLATSDTKPDKQALLIWTCSDPGLYYIDVCGWCITDYTISVTQAQAVAPDQYENDDTSAQAAELTANGPAQTHTAHVPEDADWVYFDGTAGRYYCVVIEDNMNMRIDMDVYAEDDLSAKLTPDVAGLNQFFGFNCKVTKRYYVKLTAFGVHEGYNVRLEAADGFIYGSAYNEYTNSTQGHIWPDGICSVYNFHSTNDTEDFYALNLTEAAPGTRVKIETQAPLSPAFENPKLCDTELFLYDVPGIQLAYDDDGGTDGYSRIVFTCDEPGRYFIRVKSKGADVIGNYVLGASIVE